MKENKKKVKMMNTGIKVCKNKTMGKKDKKIYITRKKIVIYNYFLPILQLQKIQRQRQQKEKS